MIGSVESFETRDASRKSPASNDAKSFSNVCGSRLRLSRPHQKVRSPTTATATIPVIRIGHMIGPPASKYFTKTFANIPAIEGGSSYRYSVQIRPASGSGEIQEPTERPLKLSMIKFSHCSSLKMQSHT